MIPSRPGGEGAGRWVRHWRSGPTRPTRTAAAARAEGAKPADGDSDAGHRQRARGQEPGGGGAALFGAVRPATGEGFALVLPEVSTEAMQAFLDHFAATVASDAQVVLILDGAGWHVARDLSVPANITPVPLPAYAPGPAGQCPAAGGAGLAVPSGALPLAPCARRLRRDRRGLLRGLERADAGAPALPHRLCLDREGRFLGSAV
jgi:DDE superfamily endonuclease